MLAGSNPVIDANIKAHIARLYARWGKKSEAQELLEQVSKPRMQRFGRTTGDKLEPLRFVFRADRA